MEGVGIIRHQQSGELYAYDESTISGSRGYGPLHHSEVPTNPTEVLNILDNQPGHDLEDDGNWLWDEMQAGRAILIDYVNS
tara:strand:+ start:189 stop:431 length:243 start_codon:yes stop_codon:yes gene_type:complete